MAIRSHDLIPMTTSGHCAWGKDHSLCHKVGCTCSCHTRTESTPAPPTPTKRVRKRLI